jgi:hypothetical protein
VLTFLAQEENTMAAMAAKTKSFFMVMELL